MRMTLLSTDVVFARLLANLIKTKDIKYVLHEIHLYFCKIGVNTAVLV